MNARVGRFPMVLFASAIVLGGPRCIGTSAGIEVPVDLALAPASFAFTAADGREVHPTQAWVRFEGVELVPCEEPTVSWRGLRSVARAHDLVAEGTGAMELDLLHTTRSRVTLGVLFPAPDEYCALRVHVAEAEFRSDVADRTLDGPIDIELPLELALEQPAAHPVTLALDYRGWLDEGFATALGRSFARTR